VEPVGVVKRKSRGPVVREADEDDAVRYVSVAWKVMYVDPVVVDTSSLNVLDPGEVPSVHVVPPVAFPDFTFITAAEPSFETVCVSPCATVVVAVLSATEPNAIDPSDIETARLVADTVAATVAVEAARALYPQKVVRIIAMIMLPSTKIRKRFAEFENELKYICKIVSDYTAVHSKSYPHHDVLWSNCLNSNRNRFLLII